MSADADQFFDTLNFVLHFLREEGFSRAEESLRQELSTRFELSDNQLSTDTGDGDAEHSAEQRAASSHEDEAEANWLGDSRPLHENPQTVAHASVPGRPPTIPDPASEPTPEPPAAAPVTQPAAPVPPPAAPTTPSQPLPLPPPQATTRMHLQLPPRPPPAVRGLTYRGVWRCTDEVDEYDSMDDPGYYRKEVVNQQRFIETELIMEDDEDGFHEPAHPHDASPVPLHASSQQQQHPHPQQQGSPSSVSSTGSLQYSSERALSGSPLSISASQARSQDDEAWELGPTDIRLVDPVSAPGQASDAPARPLRRVESLSNSFKDDGEAPDSCDTSFVDSEPEPSGEPAPCTIDLAPPASQTPPPELPSLFDGLQPAPSSTASSADLTPTPPREAPAAAPPAATDGPLLQPSSTPPSGGLSIQTTVTASREEAPAGGFSFPITPPTSEPDQLFSSWPSFRSPTSEMSPDLGDGDGPGSDDEAAEGVSTGTTAAAAAAAEGAAPAAAAAVKAPDTPVEAPVDDVIITYTKPLGAPIAAPTSNGVVPPAGQPALRTELTAHMISLSLEDEALSEKVDDDEEGPAPPASTAPTMPPAIEEDEGAAEGAVWDTDDGAAPRGVFVPPEPVAPQYVLDEDQRPIFVYNEEYITRKYETFDLKIIHRRARTGFEETKDFPIRINDLVAGRYQIMDTLGSAAFSRAVQALDIKTGALVCLKIIKNNKDYFDQSLDEIKLLHYVNSMDPNDEHGVVRLFDRFYYKEHLFLVCELLRANLYEFQKFNRESGDSPYFTLGRIQKIARQVLSSLAFLHSLGLIHSDLKPENILIKSYSNCEVKVIDLGSSCFTSDHLSSYVQSRSYRAPEVILGLPYNQKIDIWSLGCILAELSSGYVLFQNDSLATLLARLEGILGPVPSWMVHQSKYGPRFYTRSGMLYELNPHSKRYEILVPKKTALNFRMPDADKPFCDFVQYLLSVDPNERPTAEQALQHPWLSHPYPLD